VFNFAALLDSLAMSAWQNSLIASTTMPEKQIHHKTQDTFLTKVPEA